MFFCCQQHVKGAHRIVFNGKQIRVISHNTLAYAQLATTKVYIPVRESADVFWYALAHLAYNYGKGVTACVKILPPRKHQIHSQHSSKFKFSGGAPPPPPPPPWCALHALPSTIAWLRPCLFTRLSHILQSIYGSDILLRLQHHRYPH